MMEKYLAPLLAAALWLSAAASCSNPTPAADAAAKEAEPAGIQPTPSEVKPAAPGPSPCPAPPTDKQKKIFLGSPEEPPAKERLDEGHYVHSNEQKPQLFFPYIRGLGEGYVGVGSDQNYTLAAQARSDWVWLMDYDVVINRLHRVMHAFTLASDDAAGYLALWSKKRSGDAVAILEKTYAGDGDLENLVKVYKKFRKEVDDYNALTMERAAKGKSAFWLHDPGSYDYIRALLEAGRIRAVQGNLLESTTLRGIGAAASALGTRIRVIYISDAELFFDYTAAFRENFASLPADESSVVLRTFSGRVIDVSRGDFQWHYNIESLLHFIQLLKDPASRNYHSVLKQIEETDVKGVSTIGLVAGKQE